MSSPDRPKPVASATSRDKKSEFTVDVLTLDVKQGLNVTSAFAADDQDGATHQVASGGVKFSATVTLTCSGPDRRWRTGWIQTVLPCGQSVTYQNATGQGQGTMTSAQGSPARDGDQSPDGEMLCIWYDTGTGSALVSPGSTVTVAMDDKPNVPFHPAYAGTKVPGIKGWKAVGTAGDKTFCTWLVAEAENDKESPKEIVYLYFIDWTCNFGATLQDGALLSFTGGDQGQAEDITQEAFARALTRWPQVARYDLPEAWVRRVAIRLTVDAALQPRAANQGGVRLRLPPHPPPPPAAPASARPGPLAGFPAAIHELAAGGPASGRKTVRRAWRGPASLHPCLTSRHSPPCSATWALRARCGNCPTARGRPRRPPPSSAATWARSRTAWCSARTARRCSS